MIATLDPEGADPALRRAVVIGHSQGGLLTKLMTVESGDTFWTRISDRPLADIQISDESRSVIEGALFVEPHRAVERVVFIATPHRGSFLAAYAPARWMGKLVRAPANVVQVLTDVVTSDPDAAAVRRIDDVDGALGNMSPTSPFLKRLVALPISPDIEAHSIIAMKELRPKDEGSDGVVEYGSAHLEGVESEVVVESGHSCLSHPDVISEVRRILRMHLLSTRRRPRR
jgi:pimeloyl-ACP methyl ester carboxylesterase